MKIKKFELCLLVHKTLKGPAIVRRASLFEITKRDIVYMGESV